MNWFSRPVLARQHDEAGRQGEIERGVGAEIGKNEPGHRREGGTQFRGRCGFVHMRSLKEGESSGN